ncbi:MAG: hypothetical protein COU90_01550 [Candidatus Ryanbacteria bacterium CG10_big_fil_rev_8_21_14_0_10_43_42]|uniref:Uncharacterized protein n=1 Tax=Candidatus Ryanbacteria bacterium CG10_big_fil_rev_8_21_14_0_10_43_42 TaxID=1974864 RepID=A0A2M8KX52_9BACT|nr:MAG: hypothetical protein COU90_01550 [Candidatus Ryanbacteria bacterium CG10_big_fil_rev_8_21_14_0_10_43_42]
MNIRHLLIVIVIVVVSITGFGIYAFFFRTSVTPPDVIINPGQNGLPVPGTIPGSNTGDGNITAPPLPTGDTFTVNDWSGEPMSVHNFYTDPTIIITEEHIVFLHDEQTSYTLLYYPPDTSFTVSINNGSNIPFVRAEMERDLLMLLDITPQQACTLKISVRVPQSVNDKYIGKELGLSFCPTGTPL